MKTIKFEKAICGVEMLLNVGDSAALPKDFFSEEAHNTDYFEILFFRKGKGQLILNHDKIELHDYSIVFLSPFQKRQWFVNRKEIEAQFLIFQEDFLNEFISDKLFTFRLLYFYQLNYPLKIASNHQLFDKVGDIFADISFELKNPKCDSSHIVRSLLYYLLMKLNREYASYHGLSVTIPLNNYAYQFRQLLEQNIKCKQRIEDYTAMLGISRITLNKALQAQFNVSASQLIKHRLLFEIQNYLIYTNLTISEIAYELNFSEPHHLMRFFKRSTGLTTTEFRSNYQNGSI